MYDIYLNKNCKISDLIECGFRKNKNYYILNTPVYTNNSYPAISVKIIISLDNNHIDYDVINNNSGELYTHFYNRKYGNQEHNQVLLIIINELNKIFKKLNDKRIISHYRKKENGYAKDSKIPKNKF